MTTMSNDIVVVRLQKVLLDVILLNCVGWPILFLFLWGSAYQRGFFCNDTSLRHPYHESTVPSWTLYITGIGLNCVVMSLTEYLNRPNDRREVIFFGVKIPNWIYNIYCVIGIFAFGAACSQLTTDVMKYTIGRLRPHFFTVCLPDVCNGSYPDYQYHENFTCTNALYKNNKRIMKEIRLSFPSGHSSFSMYTMVYFAIYLQKRMTWDGSKLLKHTLQFLAVLSSVFTAMTRVSDYKHHWSDVLIGLLLGATVAIITETTTPRTKAPTDVELLLQYLCEQPRTLVGHTTRHRPVSDLLALISMPQGTCFSNLFSKPRNDLILKMEQAELHNLNGNGSHNV